VPEGDKTPGEPYYRGRVGREIGMDWDAIGALAELVGAVGVVLTLLFIAVQVRHSASATNTNSEELRATRLRYAADAVSRFSELIAGNKEVASIWRRGVAGEEFDQDEKTQFSWLFRNFIQLHSTGYYDSGDADPIKRDSNVNIVADIVSRNPGLQKPWAEAARQFRNAARVEFVEAVERRINSTGSVVDT